MVNGVSSQIPATTAGYTAGTANSSGTGGDYLTFLKMLTTQVQNQDPMNPMESTDFAVQLATFSGVEQQVQTNALLAQLLNGLSGGQIGQYAGWVGREVRSSGPAYFDGSPLTMQINGGEGADALTLVTYDHAGREVSRESIGTGSGEVDWQGRTANGSPLPEGLYQFRLESLRDGEVIATSTVETYAEVKGIEASANGAVLVLTGDIRTLAADVTGLRE